MPMSVKDQIPTPSNIPYLLETERGAILKKKHPYYFQVQRQMGTTGLHYCDLFVFTFHGHVCVRVNFDSDVFNEITQKIDWFWNTYILKTLLSERKVL